MIILTPIILGSPCSFPLEPILPVHMFCFYLHAFKIFFHTHTKVCHNFIQINYFDCIHPIFLLFSSFYSVLLLTSLSPTFLSFYKLWAKWGGTLGNNACHQAYLSSTSGTLIVEKNWIFQVVLWTPTPEMAHIYSALSPHTYTNK